MRNQRSISRFINEKGRVRDRIDPGNYLYRTAWNNYPRKPVFIVSIPYFPQPDWIALMGSYD